MVECDLAKVEVAGSNPVSRSKDSKTLATVRGFAMKGRCTPHPSGKLNLCRNGAR